MHRRFLWFPLLAPVLLFAVFPGSTPGQTKKKPATPALEYPPKLPGGKEILRERSADFLLRPEGIHKEVLVARTAPLVEFLYFPGQDYAGRPWSVWGESTFSNGKYYAAIGDHLAPAGNAFVYELDPEKRTLRRISDVRKTLALPDGHYSPGKIHSRLDFGSDGWLYYATHRGSTKTTTDAFHYKGDWILRCHPEKGVTEVVCRGPVGKHCIPVSITDPKRLLFYGATTPGEGSEAKGKFFVYDLANRKLLHDIEDGPARAIALSSSTGKVFYTRRSDTRLMLFDPAGKGGPEPIEGRIGIRAASAESPSGLLYTVSQGGKEGGSRLYSLDVKTRKIEDHGWAAVGSQEYITALALDRTGRYLYYCPGAHGGADRDGTPVVQFDTRTKQRKVIAFLAKHFGSTYGFTPKGTYSLALDEKGERLFITWNVHRSGRNWDCCGLTVVHIPESERKG